MGSHRISQRKEGLRKLDELMGKTGDVFVVHYSSESFAQADGHTPRVTSIAVRTLAHGQTTSFSIHKEAELRRVPGDLIQTHYDELEKQVLEQFFAMVARFPNATWLHWNMRDISFGFAVLEQRIRVLGGEPVKVLDQNKVDLARLLVSIYGNNYVGHPRLEKLMKLNKITDVDFAAGHEEARAFEIKDFVRLHRSAMRKVDVIANFVDRAAQRSLVTNASWTEIYGLNPDGLARLAQDHWIVTLISVSSGIAGLVALLK